MHRHRFLLACVGVVSGGCGDDLAAPPCVDTELRCVEPELLRAGALDRPVRPFEVLTPPNGQTAAEVLEDGWTFLGEPPLSLEPPIDWHAAEESNRDWSYHLNAWDPLLPVLEEHVESGDPALLEAALAFAEDWLAANPPAEPERETFQWYDMAVAMRASILAYLIDVVRRDPATSTARLRTLWAGLADHFEYLEQSRYFKSKSNHGFFQAAGELAAASRFDWIAPVEPFVLQGEERVARMMRQQFAGDGVHREHSPGYQHYVARGWWQLRDRGLVETDWAPEVTERLERAMAWMLLPDGTFAMFGDTTNADAIARMRGRSFAAPELAYVVSGGAEGARPEGEIAAFEQGGLVVLRSWPEPPLPAGEASYLAAQCAFHSRAHKHADDLSLVWYDQGHEILVEPGLFGYLGRTERGSPLHAQGFVYSDPRRIYVESTAAHNTVEVDGTSQDRTRPPFGSGLLGATAVGELRLAACRAPEAGSVVHTRVLVTSFGHWLLVLDVIADQEGDPHDVRQRFHFAPDLAVEPAGGGLAVAGLRRPLQVASLIDGSAWAAPVRGQTDPLAGWWSPEEHVLEPATAVALEHAPSPRAVFATLFAFGGAIAFDPALNHVVGDTAEIAWSQDEQPVALTIDGLDGPSPTLR